MPDSAGTAPTGTDSLSTDLAEETIFTWGAPPLKFGAGAVDEIGFEMAQFGARRVLILTADTYSKHIHPLDRSVRTLFGDGAAATVVDAVETPDDPLGFDYGKQSYRASLAAAIRKAPEPAEAAEATPAGDAPQAEG